MSFEAGQTIIQEGDEGGTFFIVEEGEVKCTRLDSGETEVSERLRHGAYFGEVSLLTNECRQATVTAVSPTLCLTIDRKTFKRMLGGLEHMLKDRMDLYEK